MKSSVSAAESIPEKASCASAVLPLPCMFSTSGMWEVPEKPVGTWTITVRARPETVRVRVVVPDAEVPQPVVVAGLVVADAPGVVGELPQAEVRIARRVSADRQTRAFCRDACRKSQGFSFRDVAIPTHSRSGH